MAEEITRKMENTTINKSETEDVVDPWSVKASSNKGIDYEKLIGKLNNLYKFILTFSFLNFNFSNVVVIKKLFLLISFRKPTQFKQFNIITRYF